MVSANNQYVVIDFETYYGPDYTLRHMTPAEYIMDPRFEAIGAAVCVGDEGRAHWLDGPALTTFIYEHRHLPFVSHNALFDMCIVAWRFGVVPRLMIDTMSMSRALIAAYTKGVSLAKVAEFLKLGVKGDAIVNASGMTGAMLRANPILWPRYVSYAINDAELCRDIFKRLRGAFPRQEYVVNDLVIRMTCRPRFVLDREKLALHAASIAANKQALLDQCGLTSRESLMSNEKFATALETLGVEPPTKISKLTGKVTYAFAKSDQAMTDLENHEDERVQALVAARLGHKSTLEETRTARFQSIANLDWQGMAEPCAMPMPLKYSGAHTHRLSGDWTLNLQNLPRGGLLRRALRAPPGYTVVPGDASQIEARINALVCGQDDLVEAFRRRVDVYSQFASENIYHRPIDKKSDPAGRFVGKTCLAEGTLVYTDHGLVPIEKITRNHRVWDGDNWVCHLGLAFNGFKKTLKLCNVSLTPDHLVFCGTRWWEAKQFLRDGRLLTRALAHAEGRSPSQVTSEVSLLRCPPLSCGAIAGDPSTPSTTETLSRFALLGATSARRKRHVRSGIGATPRPCPTTPTGAGFSTVWRRLSSGATILMTGRTLTTVCAAFPSALSGALREQRSCSTYPLSMGGTIRLGKWTASTSTGTTNRETLGSRPGKTTSGTSEGSATSKQKSRVYDICSAGPNSRFMIHTDQGPLLVHNCILSLGYQSGWRTFRNMIRVQSRQQIKMDLILTDAEAQNIVQAYRKRYHYISGAWKTLQNLLPALAYSDSKIMFGPMTLRHQRVDSPGGLPLFYHDLKQEVVDGKTQWTFTYQGKPKYLYGGKLLENLVQHLARLCNMDAAVRLFARFPDERLVSWALQVHDELVYIVRNDVVPEFMPALEEELSRAPWWAPSAPLAAEVGSGETYGDAK